MIVTMMNRQIRRASIKINVLHLHSSPSPPLTHEKGALSATCNEVGPTVLFRPKFPRFPPLAFRSFLSGKMFAAHHIT